MNTIDTTSELEAPEVESNQLEVTLSVNFVDGNEQSDEWGGRYKRPKPQPKPRSRERAIKKKEYGPVEDLQAVFDSRAAYFQENPKPETYRKIGEDSRDLGHVLPDFPGVHDFVFEMQTIRWKALDRLLILQETQSRLEALSRQLEAGELKEGETAKLLQEIASALRAEKHAEKLAQEGQVPKPPPEKLKSHFSINEIASLSSRAPNTISTFISEIREEDKGLPEDKQRIKTPKYKPLTREEYEHLQGFMAKKNERPKARKTN